MDKDCVREVRKRAKSEKTTRALFKDCGEFLRVENEDIEEVLCMLIVNTNQGK